MKKAKQLSLLLFMTLALLFSSCKGGVQLVQLDLKNPAVTTASFTINNYCTSPTRSFVDFFVLLRSVRIRGGQVLTNWARDGIADADKAGLGLNIFSGDQGGTGYGNLVLFKAGIPVDQFGTISSCTNPTVSSVPGLLNDCDRNFLQLKLQLETVPRSIPDDLALWFGLDLQDPAIAGRNTAGDGVSNLVKVKMNATIDETMSAATQALAPVYSIVRSTVGNHTCYTFGASNLPLVDVSDGNEVDAYILSQDNQNNLSAKVANIIFTPLNTGSTVELDYGAF
jgi:hypothetical protein